VTIEKDGFAGLGWDGHLAVLHESEAERRSRLAMWVRRGLECDERVIYGQDDSVGSQRSVLAVLGQHGIDVAAATAEGRLLVLPLAAVYGAGFDGQLRHLAHALADGHSGVRTSGEAAAAPTGSPEEAYPGLAGSLQRAYRIYQVSALCQYNRAATVGERLDQTAARHAGGIRERQLHTARSDDGLILAGEVDCSNEPVLLSVVQAATSTTESMLWLDLRRVTFLDLSGCRALAVGTRQFRERGGHVTVLVLQGIIERVVGLVGLDSLPNVEIVRSKP
jgi:anti-anti-sigma factor